MAGEHLFLGNAICLVGVAGLSVGHAVIAAWPGRQRAGVAVSGSGAFFVALGSGLLGSWPIVFLNVVWAWVSFRSFAAWRSTRIPLDLSGVRQPVLSALLLSALVCAFLSAWMVAGFITSAIYLVSYYLYTTEQCSREGYLFITLLAAFPLLPHLLSVNSFSVLFNELLGMAASCVGLMASRGDWRKWMGEVIWLKKWDDQP